MSRVWNRLSAISLLSLAAQVAISQNPPVTVYFAGSDIVEPRIQPLDLSAVATDKCKHKSDGRVVLWLVVDANGHARNVMLLEPLGNDLDRAAIRIALMDRFIPATRDGVPIALGRSLELELRGCIDETRNDKGRKVRMMRLNGLEEQKLLTLAGIPEQIALAPEDGAESPDPDGSSAGKLKLRKVGGQIKAPELLRSAEAKFSDEARRKKFSGTCVLSLIADPHGLPQNVHVVRPLGHGLDENAIEAVEMYRFKPAMTPDHEPVPVMINVMVQFRLY